MLVKDLIKKLQKMDPEAEVVVIDSLDGVVEVESAVERVRFDIGAQHLKGKFVLIKD